MGTPTSSRPSSAEPVTTAAALQQRWAEVLAPPVFTARSLWLTWLDDAGVAVPLVVPIDELPRRFDAVAARGVVQLARTVLDEQAGGGHVALALCRPGRLPANHGDQEWADGLGRAAAAGGLNSWSLHLAAGGSVQAMVAPPWPAR